ncbi:Glutamate receptor ionotropic, delta-1 [Araneus ventricosus]|uniref:Glutamate receptor ionotropic, delta-1 n=1 Tax=Araneus ventricosus TaxID=182803 RepID=A0A4Y2L369_ARAVE|nr:Glutamate receptor ionotropic, delta-1 [Araneus ventricosus]
MDFAGPFLTKPNLPRSKVRLKSYICVIVCKCTKAVHLEVVSDLSSRSLLAALRLFISRSGCPSDIYSDNGKNFTGLANQLKALFDILKSIPVQKYVASLFIRWHFIPPYSPHFGGIWEVLKTERNELETVNNWNPYDGFANNVSFHSCSIQPLKQIRVAMEKHFPFFRISKSSSVPKGSDIRLLNTLVKTLHFSYEIVRPPDGSWGDLNGTEWTGMIRMLVMDEADVAMSGMTVTYNRYTAVRFSIPYAFDRITFVSKRPSRKAKTWAIFWPYTLQVWMLIGICILIISILMTFLRNALKPPKRRTVQFRDTALYIFQAVLSQGYYNASETRCRILMTFWWGFCITVVAGYNGSLMSFMAHPGYNPSLDTVTQLVHAIRYRNFAVGTIKNSADYTVFKESTQRDLRIIFKSMHSDARNLVHHDVDGLWECLKREYAYIGGELTVKADIWDPSLFLFAKDSFLQYGYAIAFAPNFEHISLFDHKIRQLQEGGIIKKWMEDIIEKQQFRGTLKVHSMDEDEDEGRMHVLDIDDVQGAFAVLSIGLVLASIVFITEYQIHAYTQRRKRKNLKRY